MRIQGAARRFLSARWLAALVGVAVLAVTPAAAAAPDGKPPSRASAKGGAKRSTSKPAKAPARTKKGSRKKAPPKASRKAGQPGKPDEAARRIIAGAPASSGNRRSESPELRAMREIDLTLFPGATPTAGAPWPADGALLLEAGEPRVDASGLPPSGLLPTPPRPEAARDISWLRQLEMPDIPVRWDGRVVRYLEYYKDDPRGRSAVTIWLRKSGRYGAAIRRVLREQGLPEDILWLSLVESGFDPIVHSPAGAAGLWQFMPHGARIYGLTVDRWIDERLDPERSTLAAARYLSDLRRRFGGWELAFAAYNMGYGGLLAAIRKYNTNDFWELSRLEAGMPLETALYVPKIIAIAIVARNRKVFGCEDVELDPPVTFDKIAVGSGVSLQSVATAAGAGAPDIEALNPALVARRTPPAPVSARAPSAWEVRVPPGAGPRAAKSMPKVVAQEPKLSRYVVRWGESLDDIAAARGVRRSVLQSLNGLRPGESVRPGALLFVPASSGGRAPLAEPASSGGRPIVVVPPQRFSYEGRRRTFYRVVQGDALHEVAAALGVTAGQLCRWNALDPGATLHEGMNLQAFVPTSARLDRVVLLEEADARVLEVGSDEFFAHFEGLKGRQRVEVEAREGETIAAIARRHGLSAGMMERINHRSRRTELSAGEKLVVYIPAARALRASEEPPPEMAAVASAERSSEDDGKRDDAAAEGAVQPASLRVPVADDEDAAASGASGAKDGAGQGQDAPAPRDKAAGEGRDQGAGADEKKPDVGADKPATGSDQPASEDTRQGAARAGAAAEDGKRAAAGADRPPADDKDKKEPAVHDKKPSREVKKPSGEGKKAAAQEKKSPPAVDRKSKPEDKKGPAAGERKPPAGNAPAAGERPGQGAEPTPPTAGTPL